MRPTSQYAHVGFVKTNSTSQRFPISAPKRGSMFFIQLLARDTQQRCITTAHSCFGTVLIPRDAVAAAGADFAMVLSDAGFNAWSIIG
jgi:hypothetical protein